MKSTKPPQTNPVTAQSIQRLNSCSDAGKLQSAAVARWRGSEGMLMFAVICCNQETNIGGSQNELTHFCMGAFIKNELLKFCLQIGLICLEHGWSDDPSKMVHLNIMFGAYPRL